MRLSELLASDLILPGVVCASKDELIQKIVERIYGAGRAPPLPSREVLDAVLMREQIGGTLLPSGLSIPHARLRGFEGFILALATPAEALFHDGLRIRLTAMMVTSQSGGPYYLGALAALTKISRDGEYFSRLCGAADPEALFGVLRERDPELG